MSAVDWVLLVAGAASIGAAALDLGLTVLHPARRGPLGYAVRRMVWRSVRALARRSRHGLRLSLAAPLAMVAEFTPWLLLLWLGYALVFTPFVDQFARSPMLRVGEPGFLEAVYFSGTAITTVGFGDVVPVTSALRVVSVVAGATGLAAITAAITYLLSTHSAVIDLRSSAASVSDLGLGDPAVAVRLASADHLAEAGRLRRELARHEQQLLRFPVLYYFDDPRREGALLSLLHASAVLVIVLRWVLDEEAVSGAAVEGRALERTLRRVLANLERDFIGGGSGAEAGDRDAWSRRHAARELHALRHALGASPPLPEEEEVNAFAAFAGHADRVLRQLAEVQGQPALPLLADPVHPHDPVHPQERARKRP